METNVFKEQSLFWFVFKKLFSSLIIGLIVVLMVSILCGFQYKIVATGSMEPNLHVGTMVCIAPVDYEDIKVGDIITYGSGNKSKDFFSFSSNDGYTFTHRVVRISENGKIITAGDANVGSDGIPKEDGEISENRVIGKVVFDAYPVGQLILFIKANLLQVVFMIMILFVTYLIVA